MKYLLAILTVFVTQSICAFEYQIEIGKIKTPSSPGHESITSLALRCIKDLDEMTPPNNCIVGMKEISKDKSSVEIIIPSIRSAPLTAQELFDASSWPDDPTRQDSYYGAKTLINKENECKNPWNFFYKFFENYNDSISGGLFCNSHFGVLQFLHSQASKPAVSDKYTVEPYQVTRNKILSWAALNYSIIKDKNVLKEPYCEYFKKHKKIDDDKEMAESFLPEHLGATLLQCVNGYNLDWIYNKKCTHIASSKSCKSWGNQQDHQISALGALIHVVQDSYAQGHTKRGMCSEKDNSPISKIECEPITQFYDYSKQDSNKHSASDTLPILIGDSCLSGKKSNKYDAEVDDVVTATANIIWHSKYGKKRTDLMAYLESRVFVDPYFPNEPPVFLENESSGECYAIDIVEDEDEY